MPAKTEPAATLTLTAPAQVAGAVRAATQRRAAIAVANALAAVLPEPGTATRTFDAEAAARARLHKALTSSLEETAAVVAAAQEALLDLRLVELRHHPFTTEV